MEPVVTVSLSPQQASPRSDTGRWSILWGNLRAIQPGGLLWVLGFGVWMGVLWAVGTLARSEQER